MVSISPQYLSEDFILFVISMSYITFNLSTKLKWIFGSSFSVVSFIVDHSNYKKQFYPYTFDFYFNYFLIFMFIIPVFNYLFLRNPKKLKNVENPYLIQISNSNKTFYFQYGIYTFKDIIHPSLENFEPIRLDPEGNFIISDSNKQMIQQLHSLISRARNLGNITINLIKLPNENPIHHKFVLIAHIKSQSLDDFHGLDRLHVSDNRFSRFELNSIPSRIIKNMIFIDPVDNIVFNPYILSQMTKNHFEMGIYEFDLFQHLIREYDSRKLDVPYMYGPHYIGHDLRDHPVHMNEPNNLLYIGSSTFLPQIMKFDFIDQVLIITDNQKLTSQLYQENQQEIIIKPIQNIRINLIDYGLKHPKFLELLFELWAKLLPDDNKAEYSPSFVKLISQFVELKYLLDGEKAVSQLMTKDLLISKTYREYNIDISTDVLSKFRGLLDNPVFNGFKKETIIKGGKIEHIEDFLTLDPREMDDEANKNQLRYRVIDISGFSERQKQALFILFCVMKEQALIPSCWLVFSVNGSHKVNEIILKHLTYHQNFRQILLHLNEIGNDLSWIHSFDCKVHDKHLNHPRMRKYLGIEKNQDVDGLFVHQSFGRKTILKTEHDKEIRAI